MATRIDYGTGKWDNCATWSGPAPKETVEYETLLKIWAIQALRIYFHGPIVTTWDKL